MFTQQQFEILVNRFDDLIKEIKKMNAWKKCEVAMVGKHLEPSMLGSICAPSEKERHEYICMMKAQQTVAELESDYARRYYGTQEVISEQPQHRKVPYAEEKFK